MAKLKEQDYIAIKQRADAGETMKSITSDFKIHLSHGYKVLKNVEIN